MIVEIEILCSSFSRVPLENEPPPLIDSNRAMSGERAGELFEMVARWRSEISIRGRVVDHLQFSEQPRIDVGWDALVSLISDEK
jgi:hypothetical protein